MKILPGIFIALMGGAALAQETGAIPPAAPSTAQDVPAGGCMPIGVTAAGDIVFPIQCKEFIDRQRGPAAEKKTALEEKPVEVAKQPDPAPVLSKPATVRSIAPLPKTTRVEQERRKPAERKKSAGDVRRSQPPPAGYLLPGLPGGYDLDETGVVFLRR